MDQSAADALRAEFAAELRTLKQHVAEQLDALVAAVRAQPAAAPAPAADPTAGLLVELVRSQAEALRDLANREPAPPPSMLDQARAFAELRELIAPEPTIGEQALIAALEELRPLIPGIAHKLGIADARLVGAVRETVADAAAAGAIDGPNGHASHDGTAGHG